MKFSLQQLTSQVSALSILLLQGAKPAAGHYGFPIFLVNGVASAWWEYVRPVGTGYYTGQFFPIYDWTAEPQVCGFNGTKTGHQTSTAKVAAGSTIGFRSIVASYEPGVIKPRPWNPERDYIHHEGPGQAYMSKAPADLESYEGDGDWFKIGTLGSSDGQHWDPTGKTEMNFTIPKTTPPGKYLVRAEHFYISTGYNSTQQFISCAHVEVTGEGGGKPGPMIKFPGGYDIADPGIWLPPALYQPHKPTELLKNYKGPGPAVWTG